MKTKNIICEIYFAVFVTVVLLEMVLFPYLKENLIYAAYGISLTNIFLAGLLRQNKYYAIFTVLSSIIPFTPFVFWVFIYGNDMWRVLEMDIPFGQYQILGYIAFAIIPTVVAYISKLLSKIDIRSQKTSK